MNSQDVSIITVAAVRAKAAIIAGEIGGVGVEMMLDSGSTVSLIRQDIIKQLHPQSIAKLRGIPELQLITASGEPLQVVDHIEASIRLRKLEFKHRFVVVNKLITHVILGVDFLQCHGLVLDFNHVPVDIYTGPYTTQKFRQEVQPPNSWREQLKPILGIRNKARAKVCAVDVQEEPTDDTIEECRVPDFGKPTKFELPECADVAFKPILVEYQDLFVTKPGVTKAACHLIPTNGPPVRVPPRRIPAHYRSDVERQIHDMLKMGIIEESSSPWMAPAVFVPKKNGDIRICIDYRELNKRTIKDAYPLPLPDEVQDRLAGSTVFTTLDLQNGYWQVPVHPQDYEKTAFCPGPGMGLYQFRRMPFGLTGAPSSFQRVMDAIFRGLPFVTTYIDDVLIHSSSKQEHLDHLRQALARLKQAGLTLRGKKCHLGMAKVTYLGHVFSGAGMSPDQTKTKVVDDWPTPTDVSGIRKFLGLSSYYRRYIPRFSEIAAPLNDLTQKGVSFSWDEKCQKAFSDLKQNLTHAPILTYPCLDYNASPFTLQTDASSSGVGAVLEQDNRVICYASRTLSKSERQYSVIQRECLAVVYAMKQFRHYLLGRPFHLVTDHAPLQWLSAQKMEGMLCRWALAMQEYDFTIKYRKGSQNSNADALSRLEMPSMLNVNAAISLSLSPAKVEIYGAQKQDTVLKEVRKALLNSTTPPRNTLWNTYPLRRYKQLWSQITLVDDIICRSYCPGPSNEVISVPLIPIALQKDALIRNHDNPSAGHQGGEKTLQRLRQEAYWVNMAQDVEKHCQECLKCQQSKQPKPTRAPMTSIPIGRPWEMIAVDILELPVSSSNNRYLLVIQDYFTKWAEAIPMKDQTASRITNEIVKVCSLFGIPKILHSDQGRNFESTILRQTLQVFGIKKSRTTAYHPQGDGMVERFNRSLLQLLRSYVEKQEDWEKYLPMMLFAYRTAVHSSTGVTPFMLMFGRQPNSLATFAPANGYDPDSYQAQLKLKLAELYDLVEVNLAAESRRQREMFNKHSAQRSLTTGDKVWLSIPTAGKLQPKWDGTWEVRSVKNPITIEITDGNRTKTVHVNRLRHQIQPNRTECDRTPPTRAPSNIPWQPTQIEQLIVPSADPLPPHRYPIRNRRPPDRYTS